MNRVTIGGSVLAVTAAVLVAGAAGPARAAADQADHGHVAQSYSILILKPTEGGVASGALGINDDGLIVGVTRPTGAAQPQATSVWEIHGDHTHDHQLPNLPGSVFSRGFDINNDGVAVGEAFDPQGNSVPIRWDGEGQAGQVDLGAANGRGILNDISDAGVSVGTAGGEAVSVGDDGTVTILADPDHESGAATSAAAATTVAESGDIAGRVTLQVPHGDHTHAEVHPIAWRDGQPSLLAIPSGASQPVVAGIDEDGTVVGALTQGGLQTAVVWDASGDSTLLTTPTIADHTHAAARGVGDDGVVVGFAATFAGNPSLGGSAVAWDAHGPVDLNTRVPALGDGIELQSASDINDSGQIVGSASTPDGQRGYVLTPIEEDGEGAPTEVSAADLRQIYGRAAGLSVVVSPEASGSVTVTAGDQTLQGTVTDGRGTITLPAKLLVPGTHELPIAYAGVPGEFAPSSGTASVRVAKAAANLRAKPANATVERGSRVTVRVQVRADGVAPTGRVRIALAGRSASAAVNKQGVAKVSVQVPRRAQPGRATVRVRYQGDTYVAAAQRKVTVRITR